MKETVNASLAQKSFIFEEDAYTTLKRYLESISERFEPGDQETLGDIEYRLAEIFRQKLTSPMMVVTLRQVHEAMDQMGRPSDFGECRSESRSRHQERGRGFTSQPRPLYRSRENRSIAGVCGGIAEHMGWDVSLLRLATLLLMLFGGLSFWIYVILWLIIPEEPARIGEKENNPAH